jgi:hypothetical protein
MEKMRFVFCFTGLLLSLKITAQTTEQAVPGHHLFANGIAAAQRFWPQYNGQNTLISIKEFSFDSTDIDFKGRVQANPAASGIVDVHASLMATLAAGAGTSEYGASGVAPGARLMPSSFVGLMPDADYSDIQVQNHSYGSPILPMYSAGARAYDVSAGQYPALLHVFSAGNRGDSLAPFGVYAGIPGYANLSGHYKMAKNILLAGATDSFQRVIPLSSRGPAHDGRIKPDLCAFGQDGSSGAAALVSGSAAVLQQACLEQLGHPAPSSLIRALLLGSTRDLGAPGPDYQSGFGSLDLYTALQLLEQAQLFHDSLNSNTEKSLYVSVGAQTQRLRVTLCWTDPPAEVNCARALLNDLDLELIGPNGQIHLPWTLSTAPHADSLALPARKGRDTLNNVEQAEVSLPAPGLWQVRIRGRLHSGNMQAFSVVWQVDTLAHFRWLYPLSGAPAPAGREVPLQWQGQVEEPLSLDYRDLQTGIWQPLAQALEASTGYFRWTLPQGFLRAQLRARAGSHIWLSDTFLIAPPLRMKVGFNCPDSVLLYWNQAGSGAGYEVSALGERYLEPVRTVSDTFIVFPRAQYPAFRYAVRPVWPGGGLRGARSAAPDVRTQGVACYTAQFLAEWEEAAAQVQVQLVVGTVYGLEAVLLEKWQSGQWATWQIFPVDASTVFTQMDSEVTPGIALYRVSYRTRTGTWIIGETAQVYIPSEAGIQVFPCPAYAGAGLKIITRAEAMPLEWRLFDMQGREVLQATLEDTYQVLLPADLAPGMYIWRTQLGAAGKILISSR